MPLVSISSRATAIALARPSIFVKSSSQKPVFSRLAFAI
jgi:hypothetical protein